MHRGWRSLLIGAALVGGALALSRAWPILTEVTTGETPEYPDLQPRRYTADRDAVFQAAQTAARRMPLWRLVHVDPALGVFRAHAVVLPIPFRDEVTVWVQSEGEETVVNVRSRSLFRHARGDLGVNARRVRAFLRALDRDLRGG
jgi:uncharacterized protein (DUF1499 family)